MLHLATKLQVAKLNTYVYFFLFADIDLNSWIRHFEPAHYDPVYIKDQHKRLRRSLDVSSQQNHIYLNFKGHDR